MNYCVQLRHTQAHRQTCSRNQLHVRWFLIKSFIRQNEVKELKKEPAGKRNAAMSGRDGHRAVSEAGTAENH